MSLLRRITPATRLLLAAVLALCLGVRLLTPPGFMPALERGALAIVPCPGADGAIFARAIEPMPGMDMGHMDVGHMDMVGAGHGQAHDGKDPLHQQSCPYAAAASIAGLDTGFLAIALVALLAALPPAASAFLSIRRQPTRDRPPSRGPPALA